MKTLFSFFSHENRVRGIFEQRLINSKDICLARAKGTSLSLSLSSFDLARYKTFVARHMLLPRYYY